jgi:ATP synthase subunit 6
VFIKNIKGKFIFWSLIPSIFLFIFMGNLIGLIPYSNSITSYLFLVFLYAAIIFLSLNIAGLFIKKWSFFSAFYAKGTPFLLIPFLGIVEIISYCSRVISLTVRLFANIVAGHLLLKVLGLFIWKVFPFGITSKYLVTNFFLIILPLTVFFLLILLELFVSFIQAYIFTLLLTFYINESITFIKIKMLDKNI